MKKFATEKELIIKERIESFLSTEVFSFIEDGNISSNHFVKAFRKDNKHLFSMYGNSPFINFARLCTWMGIVSKKEKDNLRNTLYSDTIFRDKTFSIEEEKESPRLKAAQKLGLFNYVNLTSKITAITPSAVEYILTYSPVSNRGFGLGELYRQYLVEELADLCKDNPSKVINILQNKKAEALIL